MGKKWIITLLTEHRCDERCCKLPLTCLQATQVPTARRLCHDISVPLRRCPVVSMINPQSFLLLSPSPIYCLAPWTYRPPHVPLP
jgi:hypothetical protein